MPVTRDEALIDINEAARLLSVTPESIRRWVGLGYLEAKRLPGGAFRFTRADLEALLEATNDLAKRPEAN